MGRIHKIAVLFLSIVSFQSCSTKTNNDSIETKGDPQLVIQHEMHNFGTLEAGEIVTYSFKIKNSGEGVLSIDSVSYSCGCLMVTWPEQLLKPGETGFISVTYDSSGEWGNNYKTIEIYSNTPEKKKNVYIAAKVNNQLFNQE